MALTRAVIVVALLACTATCALAGACKQNLFCERWMCEQNENRRDKLKAQLGAAYNMDLLDQCNNQQNADILSTTCTLEGFGTFDIGMRYQVATCEEERPPQLAKVDPVTGVNNMAVQSKSIALYETNLSKTVEAEKLFNQSSQCGQAGFQPVHPCICEPGIARDWCVARIRLDVFFNKTSGNFNQDLSDRFAGEFVLRNSQWNVNLDVTDPTGARPDALANCVEHFGMAACDAISPAPPARNRLLRRRVLRGSQS